MFRYWWKSIRFNDQAKLLIPWLELHGEMQTAGKEQTAGGCSCWIFHQQIVVAETLWGIKNHV